MSDRETSIGPRDRDHHVTGVAAWGRKSRPEMIEMFRKYYRHQAEEAARALALTDDELIVATYLGPYARRKYEEVRS